MVGPRGSLARIMRIVGGVPLVVLHENFLGDVSLAPSRLSLVW
jgi:hypothetical protein